MAFDSIGEADKRLMRRATLVLGFLLLFVFAFSRLELLYGQKFFDVTGRAEWIWPQHRMAAEEAVAFYAAHDFDLPPQRLFTRIKILGDPEYTLYFNGTEVGGRRVGEDASALDVYDVSKLARNGRNRMVVAVRSANGVGGLIASIDIAPDFLNYVVTGRDWKMFRTWRPGLITADAGLASAPMLLGRPPARRWNFLTREPGPALPLSRATAAPREVFPFTTALAEIQVRDGVAISVPRPTRAVAYDFGIGMHGRLRLTRAPSSSPASVTRVRFATERSELFDAEGGTVPFVFANEETSVTDSTERVFRYAVVYGSAATADVVQ
jgi:hypothetical protein